MDSKVTFICTKCDLEKVLDDFHKQKSAKNGYCKQCKDCRSIESKIWRLKNLDRKAATSKSWYELNKVRIAITNKKWKAANKERCSETTKKCRAAKPYLVRSYKAKRRSVKLNATPTWLSQLELEQIKSIYKQAVDLEVATGIPHHVDHFIPLIHPLVCGFHCLSNLRVITAKENLQKGNKFTPFIESDSGYSE